jgi:hypothetical protein
MTRSLLTLATAVTFATVSGFALAAGPNDGPKYPNMESHKQYKDQRILDHANAAPRYAVTATNKQYKDQRIADHNNAAPRYAATVSTASTTRHASVVRKPRYVVHARHGAAGTHG